jgi:hypothetical protein
MMGFAAFVNLTSWAWRQRRLWPYVGVIVVFLVGVVVGRTYYPRIVRELVDREIVKEVIKLLPGEVKVIFRDVPGPTNIVRVPVEVSRIVTVAGPERIVTVTKPVDVSVEVIRDRWPQTITVRVGGVQSGGLWYVPDFPDLTLGQVAQGVYAVSAQMPGWRVERVTTETRVEERVPVAPLFQRGFTVGLRTDLRSAWTDVVYRNLAFGGEYQVRASVASWQGGRSYLATWDLRF